MNPTIVKPQKSIFWVWTTLWLTSFIDSGLIFSVFVIVLTYLPEGTPVFVLLVLGLLILLLSLWLGAYFSVKYVLRKSIVLKSDANKLAILSIAIPTLFWLIKFVLGAITALNLVGFILTVVIIYFSIKKMILDQGSI